MYILVALCHIAAGVFLIAVVLLQRGKGADLAGAFGGGGSQTAFGPRGTANMLSRATTICAALFMITSLSLSILSGRAASRKRTVLEQVPTESTSAPAPAPEVPPMELPTSPEESAPADGGTPPPQPQQP